MARKTRKIYRYIGEGPLLVKGYGPRRTLQPGAFISKALFDILSKGDTIEQEISCGR